MKTIIACALVVYTAALAYDGYDTHKRLDNLSTRVGELEDRILIQDEARREIQRLAIEQQKQRKGERCRPNNKQSL